jgi:predicted ATPase
LKKNGMKIKLNQAYKSLQPFISEELPNFTIVIGKNGSGKSQLVEKFAQLAKSPKTERLNFGFSLEPVMDSIYTETLTIDSIQIGDPNNYRNQFVELSNKHSVFMDSPGTSKAWNVMFLKKILINQIRNFRIEEFEDMYRFKDLLSIGDIKFVDSDTGYIAIPRGVDENISGYNRFLGDLIESLPFFEASSYVAIYHNKELKNITLNDFITADLPVKLIEKNSLIESRIEDIFYNYLRKRQNNDFYFYKKSQHKIENSSISPDEFNQKHPNPMVQINNILQSLNLPYYFKEITDDEFIPDSAVYFDFIKKTNETKIEFRNLSSGEKIILGLIVRLFTSEFYNLELSFPDLLVLDEPDAHLHPEMSKILIDVLNNSFVKSLGMKILITTHSPTTVALAPEDSVFQLNNDPITFLRKIQKDDALKILTTGLPNLSIDYESHKQIFVESPTDRKYYQTLFNKLNADINLTHQLYFISNGYGKSNCDQVRKIVKDLRESANKTVFGIIDWDNKNASKSPIFVHGHGKRYSIENYIFDPIFVSILLLERNYGLMKKAIGYEDTENQYDLIKSERAQKAIDYIVGRLEPRHPNVFDKSRLVKHSYGKYEYNIPFWFTQMNGHVLKEQLLDEFDLLEITKQRSEYENEERLIKIIAKLYPNVPSDTIDLITSLASNQVN